MDWEAFVVVDEAAKLLDDRGEFYAKGTRLRCLLDFSSYDHIPMYKTRTLEVRRS